MTLSEPRSLDQHVAVRRWLYCVAALVAVMVLVGGATRLTDSGLSITRWEPLSGAIPPLTIADWNAAFALYKETTEFQTINRFMTMDQFKVIFWWEWGHRFLGRLIGLVVILPLVWFWLRGRIPRGYGLPLVGLTLLGGLQGAIGWWMVKSGLTDRVDVSQIRLAIHLTMACIIFAWTIWIARSLASHTASAAPEKSSQAGFLVLLVLIQIFVGGLLAGLDAGMAYNTWPKMDGAWVPEGLAAMSPGWLNLTDNAKTVQFMHRITAYVLWIAVLVHAVSLSRKLPDTPHSRRGWFLVVLVTAQAMVGIVTLVLQVPLSWALVHQAGGLVVLAFATAHWRGMVSPSSSGQSTETSVNAVYGTV